MEPEGPQTTGKIGRKRASLVAMVLASLVLTSSVNRMTGNALIENAPSMAWLATAAIPSSVAILGLFLWLGNPVALRWPRLSSVERSYVWQIAMAWLAIWIVGSLVAAALAGGWITYARGAPALLAFLVFGPLGEEMLFRGLIFDRALQLRPDSQRFAIIISTAAFGLHHLQLHASPFGGPALAQLAFTVPMGVVFASLRARTGSLWPSLLLHVATNLPASF